MKKILPALLFLVTPCLLSAQVTTAADQYTTEQLVNEILSGNPLAPATNITAVTGVNFNSVNGIGYFQKNGSDFPFESGIIISSGDILNAAGPYTNENLSSGSDDWAGDSYINTIINASNESLNASVLEFDFLAFQDHISFDYIYASNEYGQFQCNPSDAIAFLLTDVTAGTPALNMAVVPGTDIPVSVTTIRSNLSNTGAACPSVNPEYFGNYYVTNAANAPLNMRGITVPLTAQADVIEGHTYHLKLVVADRQDALYDSAVFINAGSFSTGNVIDQEAQIQSSLGAVLCEGYITTLTVPGNEFFTYEWSLNGMPLDNAGNSLNASEPGEYSVNIINPDNQNSYTASITIVSGAGYIGSVITDDILIYESDGDGISEFDLSEKLNEFEEQFAGSTISFHQSMNDAGLDENPVTIIYTNVTNPQTIYARIENENGCYAIAGFDLVVSVVPPPTGDSVQYFSQGQTIADLQVTGQNIKWYSYIFGGEPISVNTYLTDGATYYASQTIDGVESITLLTVTVHALLGLNDNIFNNLVYYPNPAKDIINFSNTTDIDTVTFTNMVGQLVLNKSVGTATVQIDVSGLAEGVYFAKVTAQGKTKTVKIVKE